MSRYNQAPGVPMALFKRSRNVSPGENSSRRAFRFSMDLSVRKDYAVVCVIGNRASISRRILTASIVSLALTSCQRTG